MEGVLCFAADVTEQVSARARSDALAGERMALANEKRAELEAAIFDLNTVSRTLSDVMLTRAGGPGQANR